MNRKVRIDPDEQPSSWGHSRTQLKILGRTVFDGSKKRHLKNAPPKRQKKANPKSKKLRDRLPGYRERAI